MLNLKKYKTFLSPFVLFLTLLLFISCNTRKFYNARIEAHKIPITQDYENATDIENFINPYRQHINKDLDSIISYAPETLDKSRGKWQTTIGNLLADITLEAANKIFMSRENKNVSLCLLNHGGIRAHIAQGYITARTAYEVMPFENTLLVLELKGEQIIEMAEYIVREKKPHPLAGMEIVLDATNNIKKMTVQGKTVNPKTVYYVATSDYLANGGDNMFFFKQTTATYNLDYKLRNILIDYFKKVDNLPIIKTERIITVNRRDFIQKSAAGTLITLGGLSLNSFNTIEEKKITILHTNDVHSHIDPFPPSHSKYPNMGGAARRATVIEKIRKENPNTLLLDAGDVFQGTPYFNYYGGELELKLMSMMKYDLSTLGNHEFDNGIDGFYSQLKHADFDFVNANYDFKNTILNGIIKPYKIFEKDGIKIGVFGLGIELQGLVNKNLYKETIYNNPIEIAQEISKTLKTQEKCDLIICLSHLGFIFPNNPSKVSDISLAKATKDIDLIIGGHTHTFLNKPYVTKNSKGKEVLINQVGCHGINLGRIDFTFINGKKTSRGKSIII